tara:strand:+ start:22253 stop:24577 length:2325 start_codon:yes stop_codon:yes gene_type:complete
MRTVQLYINDKKVDLFKDEKIQVTSSIQNVQDISKTFTDFSQAFTVPCSSTNNDIFSFFYNNDVDGTFVAKERADARIEINHIPFRRGKVQLEGSEIKDNQAYAYKITFYGEVVTLKDLFGVKKLGDLDYDVTFAYTGTNVNDTFSNTGDLDIRFPLISSDRVWQYGDGTANDISIDGGKISFTELYPAVKDKVIIDAIETEFGVDFNSLFFDSNYFKKSFTLWKNSVTPNIYTEAVQLTFNNAGTTLVNNILSYQYQSSVPSGTNIQFPHHFIEIDIATSPALQYFIDVYKNGVFDHTITGSATGSGTNNLGYNVTDNVVGLNDQYTFFVRVNGGSSTTVTGNIKHSFMYWTSTTNSWTGAWTTVFNNTAAFNSTSVTTNMDLQTSAPDMLIADWFSGILKQFNLTCYPLDSTTNYKVEPLEQWYNFGGIVDITPYTDTKSIKVDRIKLYKKISFEYQKSKAFLNEDFLSANRVGFGDLSLDFPYDGKDFKVKLPFENMQFTKFSSTNLQVSYALDKAVGGKSYVPKPVKLFMDDAKTVSFRFYNGTDIHEVTSYHPFGQDLFDNMQDYSQNFGLQYSALKDKEIANSLYATFYQAYLVNLFSNKTRKVTVKCNIPLTVLTTISLDDAIIIRDKKYRIESMKTDLTTGDVDFVLISDFVTQVGKIEAPLVATLSGGGLSSLGGDITLPVKILKSPNPTKMFDGGGGSVTFGATRQTQFVTLSLPVTYTSEGTIAITVPRNTTGSFRQQTIPVSYKDSTGSVFAETEIVIIQNG